MPGNDRPVLSQRLHDRRESSSGYAVRVVALLDIMGASAAPTTPERARRFSNTVAAVLDPILRHWEEPWLVRITGDAR